MDHLCIAVSLGDTESATILSQLVGNMQLGSKHIWICKNKQLYETRAMVLLKFTGRDRLRLTALTTNHHGGGAKGRSCTFVVYRETMQRQHTRSRTDIAVHAEQLMWGII